MRHKVLSLRHVGIVVKDIEIALTFYRDILGLKLFKKTQEDANFIAQILNLKHCELTTWKFKMQNEGIIELLHFEGLRGNFSNMFPYDFGITHFALTVNNIENLYNKLLEKGGKVISPPKLSPDKLVKVFFGRDFENNLIEFVEVIG